MGPSVWCWHPPLPIVPRGVRPGPARLGRSLWSEEHLPLLNLIVGTRELVEGRGGRALSLPPLCSARNAL
ncbi:hypothetical protein NDU88_002423 [Pleurodeles waltl]|uniref:Uncharacterized protein n=1 Tax=Pleurodeles waltl TaxID=8319 RepID=A0AAV7WPI8_PLEWA|nr:hypothetical protein NDU88_002423 [Pleurodeles waltl]